MTFSAPWTSARRPWIQERKLQANSSKPNTTVDPKHRSSLKDRWNTTTSSTAMSPKVLRLPVRQREELIRAFRLLAGQPHQRGESSFKDSNFRDVHKNASIGGLFPFGRTTQ